MGTIALALTAASLGLTGVSADKREERFYENRGCLYQDLLNTTEYHPITLEGIEGLFEGLEYSGGFLIERHQVGYDENLELFSQRQSLAIDNIGDGRYARLDVLHEEDTLQDPRYSVIRDFQTGTVYVYEGRPDAFEPERFNIFLRSFMHSVDNSQCK